MREYRLKNGRRIILREANGDDAGRVIKYTQSVASESDYLTFGKGEFNPRLEDEARFIESCNNLRNSLFLIAEDDGEIIGCLTFTGGSRSRVGHFGEFGITVLRRYWGLGLGKILINHLIQWAKETNIVRKINLKVRADNLKAIRLYRKFGFIKEGTISRFFYHNNRFYDVSVMGREID